MMSGISLATNVAPPCGLPVFRQYSLVDTKLKPARDLEKANVAHDPRATAMRVRSCLLRVWEHNVSELGLWSEGDIHTYT